MNDEGIVRATTVIRQNAQLEFKNKNGPPSELENLKSQRFKFIKANTIKIEIIDIDGEFSP